MAQVFISYKSEDGSWAARLADTLTGFGLNVFRDHSTKNGIRIGEQWNAALDAAVRRSTHMVVLWSKKLKDEYATSVAREEITLMRQLQQQGGTQRFVPVLLDGSPIDRHLELGPYQGEISLERLYARVGPAGADKIRDPEWYAALMQLLELFEVRDITEVRYAVGAMTRKQATDLQRDPARWAQDLDAYKAVQALRLKTLPYDPDQYGDTPDDWKPFPDTATTIGDLITDYDKAKRHHALQQEKVPKWVLFSYSSQLLSDEKEDRDRVEREAMSANA